MEKIKELPLVSIIVPIYNEEENIKRNIESLISQDYENIEIIIIDDGSEDEAGKIIKRYMDEDKRIKMIQNEKNMGASYTRNVGLDLAKGKYIIFVDGDDWAEKNLVSNLVKIAENEKLDLVQINYIKEETDKSVPQKHFRVKDEPYQGKEDMLENISAIISNNKSSNNYFSLIRSVSGKIFKRNLIEKGDKIRFKEDLIVSENLFFTLEYILRCKKIKYVQKYLIHFKKDKDGIESSYIENIEKDIKASIKYMKNMVRTIKTELKLNKVEKQKIDTDFSFFIFERIQLMYKHKINREEEALEEKDKKRELLKFIRDNKLVKYLKEINTKELKEMDRKFLKYIKNAIFLKRFRII